MSAAEIARALGRARRSGRWWRSLCPVHGSRTGRSVSLALRDGERGLIVKCWAGCDPRDVLAELRRCGLLHGLTPASGTPRHFAVRPDENAPRIAAARRIWEAAQDARGSPVERYLHERGFTIPVPPSLRWAPRCWHSEARAERPAMVARVVSIDGELIGIHRTWLYRDNGGVWRRRDRASLGPIGGGAVRLAPAAEVLMIGEGIETCMAAMTATAQPAWSAVSTSGMIALALPPIVRHVVILADHDVSGAGERAARAAAARWLAEGRRVRVALPAEPGTDMADVLAGRGHAAITELHDAAA